MLKTTIYLSSNIDENEKIKSLASFNEPSFNLHFFNSLELAQYLLQLSGITYDEHFVSNEDLAARIYSELIKIDDYFALFSFDDTVRLVNTLYDLRSYIIDDEYDAIHNKLPKDKFEKKNAALLKAYDLLIKTLKDNKLIEEIGIIRLALSSTKIFSDVDFRVYEKSHLYPLELALINKAAGKELSFTPISDKELRIKKYIKAFGQVNEVEAILSYIYENNLPFDQCLIASAETKGHAIILSNYRDLINFPLTLGVGKTLLETLPGRLYSSVDDWIKNHYHVSYLTKIIFDESFNLEKFKIDMGIPESFDEDNEGLDYLDEISLESIIDTIGRLKISFDEESNNKKLEAYSNLLEKYQKDKYEESNTTSRIRSLKYVKPIIALFNKGMINLIEEYSLIVDEKSDKDALNKIIKLIGYEKEYNIPYKFIEKKIKSTSVGREKPSEGKLYFTSIKNAASCLRKYLFIIGLNSNSFPGKSAEDPMILDCDYEAFGVTNASNRDINNNRDDYYALLKHAMKHDAEVIISFASYNSETLKNQNSSSVVFETYRLENGEDKTISDFENEFNGNDKYQYIEYFDKELLPISKIGKAISDNQKIAFEPVKEDENIEEIAIKSLKNSKKGLSASAVTNYAKCPYLFYLANVLKIPQPEEIDIFQIIPANEYGTMAHSLLEHLDKSVVKTKKEFMDLARIKFDEYLIMNPAENATLANKEREEFAEMMGNAYDMEGNEATVFAEEDVFCYHIESGVLIHGFPDKVSKNSDGTYKVIDYKTGRRIKHFIDDAASMVQCTMYSYILEKYLTGKDVRVSSFEYWYIRVGEKVYCIDETHDMKYHYDNLTAILKEVRKSMDTGIFDTSSIKSDTCRGCYYKEICKRRKS